MSNSCHAADRGVLVRFAALDYPAKASTVWPVTSWPKLVFASKGTLLVTADDRLAVLPPSLALWIPAKTAHIMASAGPCSIRTLYMNPILVECESQRPVLVRGLFRELIVEACRVGPLMDGNPLHESHFRILCHEIGTAPTVPVTVGIPRDAIARRAAHLVLEDPAGLCDVNVLATKAGCSRRTLERRFLQDQGMTIGRWIQQTRLVLSAQMLSLGATSADAGYRVGYAGASAFTQAFRRYFGVPPSEWSRSVRSDFRA